MPFLWPGRHAQKPARAARVIPDDHATAHFPLSAEPDAGELAR